MAELEPKSKKISLETSRETTKKETERLTVSSSKDGSGTTIGDAVKDIVSHLINAEDMRLLQLSPVPRNTVFDIAYDVTQRAIMDKTRIVNQTPLSAIFLEAYLRLIRGADKMLATSMMDMGRTQLEVKVEDTYASEVDR